MHEYLQLVQEVLETGAYKQNRTGVDTIAAREPQHYEIDVNDRFPLLTTKKMDGFRWNSIVHELIWYLSGEHHIRNLREKTGVWDEWADDDYNLPTAYGRFWRRYPIPENKDRLPGEWWADTNGDWVGEAVEKFDSSEIEIQSAVDRWVNDEENGKTLDQIQYIVDTLNGDNPMRDANSRRLMVTPWNPANAAVSHLPPCHAFWGVNVQDGRLNLHLTQRSGDIALGIPFNIAAYSLILKVLAKQTDFEPGVFSHTIIDAHIYVGTEERGEWYKENLEEFQQKMKTVSEAKEGDECWLCTWFKQNVLRETEPVYEDVRAWIEQEAPVETEGDENKDHVPGLLTQLDRTPSDHPQIDIADKTLDELEFEDIELLNYDPDEGLTFGIAE